MASVRSVGRVAAWRPACAQHGMMVRGGGSGNERVIIYCARKIHFHVPVCSRFKRLTLSSIVFPSQNTCSFSVVHTVIHITDLCR